LPGSRAFSDLIKTDSRIDVTKLKATLGSFPHTSERQNALWYSIYKPMENDPAVRQAHRNYLLCRDYAVFAAILIPVFGGLAFAQFPSLTTALGYVGLLFIQLVLVVRAARIHGCRFVTTVLARKSAELGVLK